MQQLYVFFKNAMSKVSETQLLRTACRGGKVLAAGEVHTHILRE